MGESTDSGSIPVSSESPLPTSGVLSDFTGNSQDDISYTQQGSGLRTSKSDTSLTDSFVIIPPTSSSTEIDKPNVKRKLLQHQNQLREGMFVFFFVNNDYKSMY